jgi:hypothetical protein
VTTAIPLAAAGATEAAPADVSDALMAHHGALDVTSTMDDMFDTSDTADLFSMMSGPAITSFDH